MNSIQLSVSKILKGLTIYIVCAFAAAIVGVIAVLSSAGALISAIATGDPEGLMGAIGIWGILSIVIGLGTIFGLFLQYGGLKAFASELDSVGKSAANLIAVGVLLMIITQFLGILGVFVPLVTGLISILCSIAAFVLNIIGYSSLQKSSSFNELGTAGAKQLFMGFIFAIIAVVCAFIPLIGAIAALVLNILYWVWMFKGWGKIKASFAA